jgi:hypothetical protein
MFQTLEIAGCMEYVTSALMIRLLLILRYGTVNCVEEGGLTNGVADRLPDPRMPS